MNRKNLTAAVLAGLAGVAGMAGAAQAQSAAAVNLNPDGLGEVLLYPYYTTNDDNTTLVTVVNTTSDAKAVKVRFLEGFNSREVLDFNLYLSEYDVWVAAIADSSAFGAEAGVPHMFTADTSCTVPYLYEDAYNEDLGGGLQAFLPYAYTGDYEDGGPTDISRTSEGYLEIIEMGTMIGGDEVTTKPTRISSLEALTHVIKEDDDGNEFVEPENCTILVENWTEYLGNVTKPHPKAGFWLTEALADCTASTIDGVDREEVGVLGNCGQAVSSTGPNSGGLFGGAAIINVPKGTMFSYDAKAIQGYDTTADGKHFYPGTIHPSLNDGSVDSAFVLLGAGQTQVLGPYSRPVDAISAVFMHNELANTFVIEEDIAAATEWVMTHPTKSWYVDPLLVGGAIFYEPDEADAGCNGWNAGEPNPYIPPQYTTGSNTAAGYTGGWLPGDADPTYGGLDWSLCTPIRNLENLDPIAPFTTLFDGDACEAVSFRGWDREESPTVEGGNITPPIVSPAPPGVAPPGETPFELCYEVNVLRFGDLSVFGTESDLLYTVTGTADAGWARINFEDSKGDHADEMGLVGLPVTGFAAEQYTNGELEGGVLANYGGLFGHKGSVCYIPANAPAGTDCDS